MRDGRVGGLRRVTGLLVIAAVAVVAASCVYFNTYYNAEKYFRRAEMARKESEQQRGSRANRRDSYYSLYEKAVQKASIVLEKHPESDRVDDAMFIVGQSLYWQQDYQYAARSFSDLELNFPDSEYYDRARLWRGRCMEGVANPVEARNLYNTLVRERSLVGDRAALLLGGMAAAEGDLRAAIGEYQNALATFPQTRLAAGLWLRVGEAHMALGGGVRLDSALAAFERTLSSSPADSVEYRARYNRGRVQYLQDRPEEALATYRDLLKVGRFRSWEGETRILIGQYYRERHLLDEALSEFVRVRDDFPQTDVSAMALYQTGLLYQQNHNDRLRAEEYFKEVGQEKRGSVADSLAREMLKTTAELDGLIEQIYTADSTAAALQLGPQAMPGFVDSTVGSEADADAAGSVVETAGDSLDGALVIAPDSAAGSPQPALEPVKMPTALVGYVVVPDSAGRWVPLVTRPKWEDEDPDNTGSRRPRQGQSPVRSGSAPPTLREALFLTAELYRDRLGQPDSAAVLYRALADRFPESLDVPRALYSLAWIHYEQLSDREAARPYLDRLVADHPLTAHANAARRLLDLPPERTAEDLAEEVFRELEEFREDRPDESEQWISRLDGLARDFSNTRTAARAAYLAAWATENTIGDSAAAEVRFDSLARRHPESVFARVVADRRQMQRQGLLTKLERELKRLGERVGPGERLDLIAAEPDSLDSVSLSRKYLGFAMRAHRHGKLDRAEELYQLSLDEQTTRNGNAFAGLGDVVWQQGYFEPAVDRFREALREKASSLLPQYRLFAYHLREGRVDSANRYLRAIARQDRENPSAVELSRLFPTLATAEPEDVDLASMESLVMEPAESNVRLPPSLFGIVEEPFVRTSQLPAYPIGARDSASVVVDVLISREGRPEQVTVFDGEEPFASAAGAAVEEYLFYPAEGRQEKPLDVWVEIVIPFAPPVAAEGLTVSETDLTPVSVPVLRDTAGTATRADTIAPMSTDPSASSGPSSDEVDTGPAAEVGVAPE